MNNLSIANKYRPQQFGDVIGQEATVSALKGKLKDGKLPRVSLFCGSHGSGKTTIARILAKAVNCLNPQKDGNPCCQCESCKNIDAGISSDVIELDAASHNKVEDAESIIRQSNFLPIGNKKIFILDEFHMMTKEAQNKLLKQVEEPPAHVMFLFCTTEENRVLPTILSRCNKFTFNSICEKDILMNLKKVCEEEQIEYEQDALKLIAKSADGHVRDSLSILELLSYEKLTAARVSETLGLATNEQIFELLDMVVNKDIQGTMTGLDEIISKGNPSSFLKSVVGILCYLCTFDENIEDVETADFRMRCSNLKNHISVSMCVKFIKIITDTLRDNRGLGLDLAIRLCFLSMVMEEEKEDKIKKLEIEIANLRQRLDLVGTIPQTIPASVSETLTASVTEPLTHESSVPTESCNTELSDGWGDASIDGPVPFENISDLPPFLEEEGLETVPFEEIPQLAPLEPVVNAQINTASEKVTVPLSIPGGIVHPKEEEKTLIPETEASAEQEKEVPVEDGQFISPMGFDDIGSFGNSLFGSTNARLF